MLYPIPLNPNNRIINPCNKTSGLQIMVYEYLIYKAAASPSTGAVARVPRVTTIYKASGRTFEYSLRLFRPEASHE